LWRYRSVMPLPFIGLCGYLLEALLLTYLSCCSIWSRRWELTWHSVMMMMMMTKPIQRLSNVTPTTRQMKTLHKWDFLFMSCVLQPFPHCRDSQKASTVKRQNTWWMVSWNSSACVFKFASFSFFVTKSKVGTLIFVPVTISMTMQKVGHCAQLQMCIFTFDRGFFLLMAVHSRPKSQTVCGRRL